MGHQELLASFTVKPLKVINFRVYGKRTAIKLEPSVYDALLEICERELIDSEELINNIKDRLLEVKADLCSISHHTISCAKPIQSPLTRRLAPPEIEGFHWRTKREHFAFHPP